MDEFQAILGQIVLVGGGAFALAYGLVRWLGEKWIEQRFAQRTEAFKREQNELLEEVRYQINTRFSRATRIHEKEFEVLPTAWKKLQDAYGHLASLASPLQEFPNLNQYTEAELEVFLSSCPLYNFQKEELRQQDDKMAYYRDKIFWIRLNQARIKLDEFRTYLRYNKIFLTGDLFSLFSKIEEVMIKAEIELEMRAPDEPFRSQRERASGTWKELRNGVEPVMIEVESAVQRRLHFEQSGAQSYNPPPHTTSA